MAVQIVFKGQKYDVIISGNNLEDIFSEYEKIRKDIAKFGEKVPLVPHIIIKGKGKKDSLSSRIINLKIEGTLDSPKSAENILKELKTKGFHYEIPLVRKELLRLVRRRELRRVKENVEGKEVYSYVKP